MPAPALPDPRASRAVLVGVSRYPKLGDERQLPAVQNNLERLAAVLRDERVWGLPDGNCTVLHQPENEDAVITALRREAEAAEDTLLFYYAGHGFVDPAVRRDLCLALPGAYEPGGAHVSISYRLVRHELRLTAARVPHKIVILDCCWSGLALDGGLGETGMPATAIEGSAVLTAAASTRQALSPPGMTYTAFTGALLGILDGGVRNGEPLLDVGTVFTALKSELEDRAKKDRRIPMPQLASTGDGSRLILARNPAAARPPETPPSEPPPEVPALTGQALADRVLELRRNGRYEEAHRLQRQAARAGDAQSVRGVAAELRRSGHYTQAAELEKGAN